MMWDQEDQYPEDPLGVGRGIVLGVLLGTMMWAAIVGGVWYFLT